MQERNYSIKAQKYRDTIGITGIMPRPPTGDSSSAAAAVFEIMPIRALYGNDPQAEDRCCVLSREYSDEQVLSELIDHIDVYETQGTGKNKTQRLVIYYKFVGYLDINPAQCRPNYTADIREGVAIEYVSCEPSDSLKELFSEGYNADDDSFKKEETEQV